MTLRWFLLVYVELATLALLSSPVAADFPSIPSIDLSAWMDADSTNSTTTPGQQKIVKDILEACRTVGFFTITNHGVDPRIIQDAWDASADFFELPNDEKLQHKAGNDAEYPYGYEQKEQLSKGKALDGAGSGADDGTPIVESKETFAIGPQNLASGMPLRKWIDTPSVPKFQPALEAYYHTMEGLALKLLELFALALDQPVDFFQDKMDHHMSALRLIHYYPLEEIMEESTRVIRAGAHTDYGALTILLAGQPGLQVLRYDAQNRSRTEWFSVPLIPGAFVINLGDLMQRWTNGMLVWMMILEVLLFRTFCIATNSHRRNFVIFCPPLYRRMGIDTPSCGHVDPWKGRLWPTKA
jgi:isopenicillin N synthase-like dioxygenase